VSKHAGRVKIPTRGRGPGTGIGHRIGPRPPTAAGSRSRTSHGSTPIPYWIRAVRSRIASRHRTRAVRIHLLPAGEGGRYGRMRDPGRTMSLVLGREVRRKSGPSSAPTGHLLPGGEGGYAPHHRQCNRKTFLRVIFLT
jgi:hypothetical protein